MNSDSDVVRLDQIMCKLLTLNELRLQPSLLHSVLHMPNIIQGLRKPLRRS